MSDIILKAENLSKQYRLGQVGLGSLAHDINRFWYKIRGKEDPYLQIGSVNDRSAKASSEYVWALQDINFEVKRGEVLGIIGKNGAGKSTLLKILSRVTAPTTGSIKTAGRIASLLEVGTGMHPELTGRENIFLNGAILGMTKSEIASKIDEIVTFSGCEMYIDTPVKRYSSGMRVRLGFAVAAFLEPDILVVDEVLAVGDAEFQKKAIGKMKDISNTGGRTVLFVSHNMGSIINLCTSAMLLEHGKIVEIGDTKDVVDSYLHRNSLFTGAYKAEDTNKPIYFNSIELVDNEGNGTTHFRLVDKVYIKINICTNNWDEDYKIGLGINDNYEKRLMITTYNCLNVLPKTDYTITAVIPDNLFTPGLYNLDFSIISSTGPSIELKMNLLTFEIVSTGTKYADINYDYGYICEKINWETP